MLFIMEGVLPFIYKYIGAIVNLTNFGNKEKLSKEHLRWLEDLRNSREQDPTSTRDHWQRLQSIMHLNSVYVSVELITELFGLYSRHQPTLQEVMNRQIMDTLQHMESQTNEEDALFKRKVGGPSS